MRLTRRGRVVVTILATLLAVALLHELHEGYETCLARGYSEVVCAR